MKLPTLLPLLSRVPAMPAVLILVTGTLASFSASAVEEVNSELAQINNFRQYSASFASAGQPSRDQLQTLADNGFDRIVNITFTSSGSGISDEDQLIKDLGMEYMQIPVDFSNPLPSEFYGFADAMRRDSEKKTLLHCQVNARATAFSFLYRVIYENVPMAEAKADMNSVWQPNVVWRDFIFTVLAENGKSPDCEGCDWTPPPPRQ
ncbi:MAG: protein tyrosine phosphatase family protein [Pseudohongiellaceae bacterium]